VGIVQGALPWIVRRNEHSFQVLICCVVEGGDWSED
jgi:hypothetical protein